MKWNIKCAFVSLIFAAKNWTSRHYEIKTNTANAVKIQNSIVKDKKKAQLYKSNKNLNEERAFTKTPKHQFYCQTSALQVDKTRINSINRI